MQTIKILIADVQYLTRVGLRHILSNQPTFQIVAEVANEVELVNALHTQHPDVVILDYDQPGRFSHETLTLIKKIFQQLIYWLSVQTKIKNLFIRC